MIKSLTASILAASLLLSGCKSKQEGADPSAAGGNAGLTLTEHGASPHFHEVLSHLDVGGKSLSYRDHAGQREFLLGLIGMIKQGVPELGAMMKFDEEKLIDELGICDMAASGSSVAKDGDLWLLRHYALYPEGLTPVTRLWGEARPLVMGSTLPAGTDFAIDMQIDLSSLPELIKSIASITGMEDAISEPLARKLPFGMSVEKAISKGKFQLLVGIELGDTGIEEMPVMPKSWTLQLTANPELMLACKPLLTSQLGAAKEIGTHKGWQLPVPPMPGILDGAPILMIEDNTLILVSSEAYLAQLDEAGGKLADNADYQAATNHFPTSGNFQAYVSADVTAAACKWVKLLAEQQGELDEVADVIASKAPLQPWSLCISIEPKGVSTIAELPFALNANTAATMAVLSTATSTLFIGARAWKTGSERASCIMNIRNIQQAVRAHQNMNQKNFGDPLDWSEIIGPDKFLEEEPRCPDGGRYIFVRTYPEVGTLACTCSKADEEGHEPENHKDW